MGRPYPERVQMIHPSFQLSTKTWQGFPWKGRKVGGGRAAKSPTLMKFLHGDIRTKNVRTCGKKAWKLNLTFTLISVQPKNEKSPSWDEPRKQWLLAGSYVTLSTESCLTIVLKIPNKRSPAALEIYYWQHIYVYVSKLSFLFFHITERASNNSSITD